MNAHATIPAEPPAWQSYLPAVDSFMPGCSLHEKRDRARLMLLRDMAVAAQKNASWEAAQALLTVEQLANAHALTRMDAVMLAATRVAVGRLYRTAMFLDEVFSDHGGG